MNNSKIIRDSVHGYIYIPEKIFDFFIDTPIFQRLRRIEQTSMRSLYPAAHHDRFIHSLGTYHLGSKAIDALYNNVKNTSYYVEEDEPFWEKHKITFNLACLLHDCAHAPFSHSFEYLYFWGDGLESISNKFITTWENLKKNSNDEDKIDEFIADLTKYFNPEPNSPKPNPHESASSLVVLLYYAEGIKKYIELINNLDKNAGISFAYSDIEFIQRAIMGIPYKFTDEIIDIKTDSDYRQKNILNCLISLLNSKSFDVDKLDYITRDSNESGVDNVSVDIERLLKSLIIVEKHDFKIPTQVDTKFNNSFILNSVKSDIAFSETNNEINIFLEGNIKLEGFLDGTIEFQKGRISNSFIIDGTNDQPSEYIGRKEFNSQNKMKATISKAIVKGSFTGTITSAKNDFDEAGNILDGDMSCHLKGEIAGVIVGNIGGDVSGQTTYHIGYKSNAINIIEDTIIARNRLFLWIYAHQKVTYTDYALRRSAVYAFAKKSTSSSVDLPLLEMMNMGNNNLSEVVRIDSLTDNLSGNYLVDDSDLYTEIKKHASSNFEYINEYLSRKHKHTIWKSFAVYNSVFSNLSEHQKKKLWARLFNKDATSTDELEGDNKLFENSILNSMEGFEDIVFTWIKPSGIKLAELSVDDTYVAMNNSVRRLKDIMVRTKTVEQFADDSFFYLYSSKELSSDDKNKLIGKLKLCLKD